VAHGILFPLVKNCKSRIASQELQVKNCKSRIAVWTLFSRGLVNERIFSLVFLKVPPKLF
jgi:hypothetical protein